MNQNKQNRKFHKQKMKELCNKVNVLYSKTDSALIYENDYKKLLSENWIGEKLGLFKVEHNLDLNDLDCTCI